MSWFKRSPKVGAPAAAPSAKPDAKVAPGTRVYHEYFVDDQPVNGRHVWLCRVYSAGGQVHEMTGSEETNHGACQSAIAWAETVKATLRGEV